MQDWVNVWPIAFLIFLGQFQLDPLFVFIDEPSDVCRESQLQFLAPGIGPVRLLFVDMYLFRYVEKISSVSGHDCSRQACLFTELLIYSPFAKKTPPRREG